MPTRRILCSLAWLLWTGSAFAQTGTLAAVRATGSERFTEEQIAAASGLHVGQTITKEELQAAADRLAVLGLFRDVRYRFTSTVEKVYLTFEVADAELVPVSFDNFPWFTDEELIQGLREAVTLFSGEAPEQGTILDAINEALEQLLGTRGVRGRVERSLINRVGTAGMMQQFRVVGSLLKVSKVEFSDPLAGEDRRVQQEVRELIGKPFSRFSAELFLFEHVRPAYLERGHLNVRFGRPQARFTGDPQKPLPDEVLLYLPVEPGPVYRWAGANWSGNRAFDNASLDHIVAMTPGDVADGMKVFGAWERVRREYGRRGYLEAKIEAQQLLDHAAGRVSYRATITEGTQYRMGQIVLTGLSLASERRMNEVWRIARGEIFNQAYYEEFVGMLERRSREIFGDDIIRYREVGRWLRTNPDTRLVDVLLDFR